MNARLILLGLFLQLITAVSAADADLVVHGAWIRAAPPNAPVLAGYMTIKNHSRLAKVLVRATSPAFASVTLHRTEHVEGVARMSHVPEVKIRANSEFVFRPDGYHLMLAQPKRPLRTGDRVSIELQFADGTQASVMFLVRDQATGRGESGSPHAGH
ncbi:MAG: copper chaperone PCu(A)C [Acidobacteria bacterium]|nr:copper chaperone PCu(A)C [Acidobacteriota bacterium]